jgi:hypothetical protein
MRIINAALFFLFASGAIGQTSFWNNAATPNSPDITSDPSAVTLGLRFYSDVPGSVTGVRFFKGPNNTGQHVGTLWSGTGTMLAQVTFSGETASGWQQANFQTPVSIAANAVYVITYLAPNGNYADDEAYPWSNLNVTPLHPSGASPGVYAYGSSTTFPSGVFDASNYYVDLVFAASTPQPPANSNSSSFWTSSAAPTNPDATNDAASVTLGLKFYSDVPGSVTGIRFYKGVNNSGPHVGSLWLSTGAKLGEVTFSGETASGWQQASFSSPVSILANTPYVISYFAPKGNYAGDPSYSWPALSAAPLHVSGSSPGVFAYGSGATFPQGTYDNCNYWVDLVFTSGTPAPPAATYSISGTVTGAGATLTLSGVSSQSTTANSAGNYSFSGLANGSYVVAPSLPGYTFTPATASVAVSGATVAGINFNAKPAPHSVSLSWNPSTSANVSGYNVYRGNVSGGPYTKLTQSPIAGSAYIDSAVASGQTYYYVSTSVDSSNQESGYSNMATATIPVP